MLINRAGAHQVDRHILAQRKCRVSNYLQCSRSTSRLLNAKNRDSNSVSLTHFWAVQIIYLLGTNMRGCVRNFSHSLRYSRYKKSDENRSQIAILPEVSWPFLACVHCRFSNHRLLQQYIFFIFAGEVSPHSVHLASLILHYTRLQFTKKNNGKRKKKCENGVKCLQQDSNP